MPNPDSLTRKPRLHLAGHRKVVNVGKQVDPDKYTQERAACEEEAKAMGQWDGDERRIAPDPHLLALSVESMRKDLSSLQSNMSDLTAAVTKLAVMEERLSAHRLGQERVEATVEAVRSSQDALSNRVRALESSLAVNSKTTSDTSRWVEFAITAVVSATLTWFLATQAGAA